MRFDRMRGSRDRDNRSQKEIYKEREMEDEEKERKRAERKATEKEEGYQVNIVVHKSHLNNERCIKLVFPSYCLLVKARA